MPHWKIAFALFATVMSLQRTDTHQLFCISVVAPLCHFSALWLLLTEVYTQASLCLVLILRLTTKHSLWWTINHSLSTNSRADCPDMALRAQLFDRLFCLFGMCVCAWLFRHMDNIHQIWVKWYLQNHIFCLFYCTLSSKMIGSSNIFWHFSQF